MTEVNEAVILDGTEANTAAAFNAELFKKAIRNKCGEEQGYGGCHFCGDRYNWKKVHHISMRWPEIRVRLLWRMVGGAFPYCEECDGKLGRLAKIKAMMALGLDWIRQSPPKLRFGCAMRIALHILLVLAGR
jgi:hypothetical protein